MPQTKTLIVGIIALVVFVPVAIFAINTVSQGFNTSTSDQVIDAHGVCSKVRHTGSNSYFVPTKTAAEWSAFRANKPADVALSACFTCGTSTINDADGNTYDTVQVGSQCWTKQSLRVGTRIDGATDATDNGTIEKYCYSDSDSNCISDHPNEPDGALYQWDEAMQYSTTEGAQGICPAGWHIPTDGEIYTMENYLDSTVNDPSATGWHGTDIGTQLKPGGSSGLEWNLAGYRSTFNSFYYRGTGGYVWSSSESSATNAWYRYVISSRPRSYRNALDKDRGFPVRCLKD